MEVRPFEPIKLQFGCINWAKTHNIKTEKALFIFFILLIFSHPGYKASAEHGLPGTRPILNTVLLWCFVKCNFLNLIFILYWNSIDLGFPANSDSKESVRNAGDPDLIPGSVRNAGDPNSILGSRRSPREGNGYPLQYSCLENSMNTGDW